MRKPKIKRAIHQLYCHQTYRKQDILRKVHGERNKVPSFPSRYSSIILTGHAFKRWNERVGPKVGFAELERMLNHLLFIPERITRNSPKRGMIDSDILFVYELVGNEIHIVTFLGRASEQPGLRNLRSFRELKFEYNERLKLELPEAALIRQKLPCIPVEYIHFEGRTTSYFLERYKVQIGNESSSLIYVKEVKNSRLIDIIEIDPDNPYSKLLNRSIMHVLYIMGYASFVQLHLEYHKPEEVKNVAEKYEERMRERALRFLQEV
ncbi:hypothetical protein [Mesobacillus sp. S13]|uniref:hypothetical protein n=1 Tax=Mesobacillus sp. S13 TaxID=2880221 RepID=UPI001CF0E5C9|nr:hypothetical protein [Mesobacillus sp. S13]